MNRSRTYHPAISRCSAGQCVHIVHEPHSPYDDLALAVVTDGGDTIGYVPRDCWLQGAVHDEGKGYEETIKSIGSGDSGKLGVVLDVCLNSKGLGERKFSRLKVGVPPSSAINRTNRVWNPATVDGPSANDAV